METRFEIETRNLTKVFGRNYALQGVDLKMMPGDFLTIVGPNGAGKTTLIRCLAALTKPSSGSVLLGGQELGNGAAELRRSIGLVTHQPMLYDSLTAAENLRFYGRMYDVPRVEERVQQMINYVGLRHRLHDPVRSFSRGMRQRLSIGRALMHAPRVMLLDEPYTGLDYQATEMLRSLLQEMADAGPTVIMTTHNLERAVDGEGQLAILVRGRIMYEASKTSLDLHGLRMVYRDCVGEGP